MGSQLAVSALRKMRDGFDELILALGGQDGGPPEAGGQAAKPVEEMTFKELKAFAAQSGHSDKGSRDDILFRLGDAAKEEPEKTTGKEPESAGPEKEPDKAPGNGAKKERQAAAHEEEDPDGEIRASVLEAVDGMSDAEILDTLAEIGAKPNSKKKLTRDGLVSAMVQAVKDGKIDLEDGEDDSDGGDDSGGDDESDGGDSDGKETDGEETDERRAAVEEFIKGAERDFASVGDSALTRGDMLDWLDEYSKTDKKAKKAAAEFKGKSDREVFDAYVEKALLYISDEGETSEDETPYTVGGEAFCCGHRCWHDAEGETYICPVCGGEYEADDGE
jgi:hypothetical protein